MLDRLCTSVDTTRLGAKLADDMSLGFNPLFDLDVSVPLGWSRQPSFGRRADIATGTTADIWPGAALVRPLPLAPVTMTVVSTSAADNVGTALGAQIAACSFIDDAGDWRVSDLLLLNGVTPVTVTYKPDQKLASAGAEPSFADATSIAAPIFRLLDAQVLVAAGATAIAPLVTNQGTLNFASGGVIYEVIPIGTGRSRSCCFHCPRGFTGALTRVHTGSARGAAEIFLAATFGLGTSFQRVPLAALNSTTIVFYNDASTTPIAERADVQLAATAGTNNVDVFGILQIRLMPNLLAVS